MGQNRQYLLAVDLGCYMNDFIFSTFFLLFHLKILNIGMNIFILINPLFTSLKNRNSNLSSLIKQKKQHIKRRYSTN